MHYGFICAWVIEWEGSGVGAHYWVITVLFGGWVRACYSMNVGDRACEWRAGANDRGLQAERGAETSSPGSNGVASLASAFI